MRRRKKRLHPLPAQPPATAATTATSTAARSDAAAVVKPPAVKGAVDRVRPGLAVSLPGRRAGDLLADSGAGCGVAAAGGLLLAIPENRADRRIRTADGGRCPRRHRRRAARPVGRHVADSRRHPYRRLDSVTDKQLRDFSGWIEGWLRTDIDRASQALAKLEESEESSVRNDRPPRKGSPSVQRRDQRVSVHRVAGMDR